MLRFSLTGLLLILLGAMPLAEVQAQCVPVIDPRQGNISTFRPLRQFRCIPAGQPDNANFTITFAAAVSNFMFDPGDGTGPQLIVGPATSITYNYPRGSFNYRIWFSGCSTDTVRSLIVNDRNTTVPGIGFITPPAGFTNKRCVPEALTIVNNSPGMNGFTQFLINWGDNTTQVIGDTFGLAATHVYQPRTTGCNIIIRVTYQNLCGATPGGVAPSASYGEYFFLDRDTAVVTPSDIILCAPTDVTIQETSILNCLDSNDRELKWEATQGFAGPLPFPGNGVYRPRSNPGVRTMNIPASAFIPIPADSTYRLKMVINNQCGPDSTFATIRIVAPRQPRFNVVNNNTCPGATMNFQNNTSNPNGAQTYFWEWGDGSSETNNAATVGHVYLIGGTYTVRLYSIINGYNGQVCQKVDSIQVQVQRTVTPILSVTPQQGCDTLLVRVKNSSVNLATVVWGGWELAQGPTVTAGTSFIPSIPGSNPATAQVISTNPADSSGVILYKTYGRFIVRLRARSTGCPQLEDADTLFVFPRPRIRYRLSDTRVCVGQTISVRDSSRVIPTNRRNLPTDWNHISWSLDFGDGTVVNSTANLTNNFDNPAASGRLTFHTYAVAGVYKVRLCVNTPYGCQVVDSSTVTVQPVVAPSFTFVQDACDPTRIVIRNTSSLPVAKYEFSFSRGGTLFTRITKAIRDTFVVTLPWVGPGDTTYYTTVLRAVTGVPGDTCQLSTAPINIKARPAPIALFSMNTTDGCTPLTGVQFFNLSYQLPASGGVTYQWNFGNGNTFTGENPPLQTYTNPGLVTTRDTIRLRLITPGGCVSTTFRTVVVYPSPRPTIVAPDTVCHNQTVTFSAVGNGLATYAWRFTDFDGSTSSSQTPTKVLTNFGTMPITYTVRLRVESSGGCIDSTSKLITVMPLPTAGFSATPEELCGNAPARIQVNALPGSTNATRFFWNFGDASLPPDSGLSTLIHTYPPNFGGITVSYTTTLRVASAFGCVSNPLSRLITLQPGIEAGISADTDKVCAPGIVNFANVGFRNGVSYTWYVRTVSGTGLGASQSPNLSSGGLRFTFTNPGNLPTLQYIVTLIATTTGGTVQCADTARDTITVYGVPISSFALLSQTSTSGCSPSEVVLQPTATVAGSSYTWNFGDGTADVVGNTPANQTHTYTNTTNSEQTYTVTLTTATPFGCRALSSGTVRVKPVPSASFSISDSLGCAPVTVRVTNTSTPAADNFVWLVNGTAYSFDRNPASFVFESLSATDTTRYVIRLVARGVGNACFDTSAPRIISVYPRPNLVLTPTPSSGCSPLTVTLGTGASVGVSQLIFQRRLLGAPTWVAFDTTSGAASSITLTNTGTGDQVWQVRVLGRGVSGCLDSATTSITVSPSIQAALSVLPDTVGCGPFTATFTNNTTSPAANAFVWTVNGTQVSASATNFQYRFENVSATRDSVYTVQLTATNLNTGCPNTVSSRIRVKPVPAVNFDMGLTPPSACSPVQVRYSYIGNVGATQYTWLFAAGDTLVTTLDTAVIRNYSNTGIIPAIRPIKLTARNAFGCEATVQKSLTINPLVRAAFRRTADSGCAPVTITFTSESSTGADVLEWIVDGVSRASTPSFTYTFANTGLLPVTYRVQLAARNSIAGGCADTASTRITVNPAPRLSALDVLPDNGCSPLQTTFFATATGVTSYRWDFNDGTGFDTTAASVSHTFTNLATVNNRVYTPFVIAQNAFGCSDTLSKQVTVRPGSKSIIRVADSVGCTPLQVQFIGSGSINANVFTWDFGDGSPRVFSSNPQHTFTNTDDTAKTYRVQLIVLRSGGFCPDTAYKTITVNPLPRVRFTPGDTTGCQPLAVGYRAQLSGTDSSRWTFTSLDGTRVYRNQLAIDTVYGNTNPVITNIQVLLEGFNRFGCIARQTNITSVGPLAEAAYTQSVDSGCSPLRVRFSGGSTPGVVASWRINGVIVGNSASGLNYTFINPGTRDSTFRVQLVIYNPQLPNCIDTAESLITVFPRPVAGLLFASPNAGCSPLQVELNGSATGGVTYNWSLGDGTTFDTTSQTISHLFQNTSTTNNQNFNVRQIVYTIHGCADTTTTSVLVRPLVRAGFTASDTAGCGPLSVQFNAATSFNANTYTWDFGDGLGTATGRTPSYSFTNTADTVRRFTVLLVADKIGVGCPSTATQDIYVYPVPRARFTPADTAGCQPFMVRLQSESQAADSLAWTLSSGSDVVTIPSRSTVDSIFTNLNASILTVTTRLEAWNNLGCVNTSTGLIRVSPFTQGGFSLNQDSSCTPFRLLATSEASVGSRVEWYLNGNPVAATGTTLSTTLINPTERDSTVEVMQVTINRLSPNCTDTVRKTIVIVARPRAGQLIATPNTGCSPLAVVIQGNATGATLYDWNLGNGNTFTNTSQTVNETFINTGTTAPRTYNIQQVALNAFGCSDTATTTVTVRPSVTAGITASVTEGCSPLVVQFSSATSVNANQYSWNFGDGTSGSTTSAPAHTFSNNSDTVAFFNVTLTADRAGVGCPDTYTIRIPVNPRAIAQATPSDTVGCQPFQVVFRAIPLRADSIRWSFINPNGGLKIFPGLAQVDTIFSNLTADVVVTTATLYATNAYGCADSVSHRATVNPFVRANFSSTTDSGCGPLFVQFENTSAEGNRIQWFVDGNLVSQSVGTFSYTFVNPTLRDTTFTVMVVASSRFNGGCTDTLRRTIRVFGTPQAGVLFAAPNNGCSPLLVELNGGSTGGVRYFWNMGDGVSFDTTSQNVSHLFQNTSTTQNQAFTVTHVVYNVHSCADTTTTRVTVRPLVRAGFTVSDSAGCAPLAVQFNAASSFNANTYTWNFGDGVGTATGRTPSYRFENTTDTIVRYVVTLVADKFGVNCPSATTDTITVYPVPRARVTPLDTAGCQPFAVRLASQSEAADSLFWTVTSGSDLASYPGRSIIDTVFTNSTPNTQTITTRLEAWNRYGCVNTALGRIRVAPFTEAGFDLNQDSACTPFRLVANSTAATGSRVEWFLNGTPAAPTGNALRATLFNFSDRDSTIEVMQVAINRLSPSCTDTVRRRIVVVAKPRAGTIFTSPDAGCSPLLVELNGNATGASIFSWNLGDGTTFDTTSQTLSHTFENLGSTLPRTFSIRMIAANTFGCADTARTFVTVRPNVQAGIASAITQGCGPLGVQLSSAPSVNANLFTWTFGDGSSGSNAAEPYHVFDNATDSVVRYTVRLVADKAGIGCPDDDTLTITVFPSPIALATPPDTLGCQPFAVRFASQSLRTDSVRWAIGQAGTQNLFPGQASVDTVFTNTTPDLVEHTATLLATNRFGCIDSVQRRIRVNPLVTANFTPSADSGCSPLKVTFTNTSAEGNRVQWYVDGTLLSQNPTNFDYTFVNQTIRDTTYTVTLVASSRFNAACADTIRKVIHLFGQPDAGVIFASPESGCSPLLVELNGNATGATRFTWNFDDGTFFDTTSQTVSHTFINPQASTDKLFRPFLVAINPHGCRDTAFNDITVRPGVFAAFSPSDTAGCAPLGVLFSNGSRNANLYQWDFGDGRGTSFTTNPFYVFENRTDTVQRFTVRLISDKNGVGCPATAERVITVYPRPVAAFSPADTANCQPFAVTLHNQAQGAQTWIWTLSGPNGTRDYANVSRIDTVIANPTAQVLTTQVTLNITSPFGCTASRTQNIRTFPLVDASFTQSVDSGCSPLRVRFENQSAVGNRTTWFINGQYTGASTTSFEYTFLNNTGRDSVVTILLAVEHPSAPGCYDTLRRVVRVFAKPNAGLLSPEPAQGCSPLAATLRGSATGATRYLFSFGDGAELDTNSQVQPHTYVNSTSVQQTYVAILIARSDKGCADTTEARIQVNPLNLARITLIDSAGCTPFVARFSAATSLNANRFEWDFGDGSAPATGADAQHLYRNPDDTVRTYRVRMIADRSSTGCPDTTTDVVKVYPQPRAGIQASALEGCTPFPVTLTDLSTTVGRTTHFIFTDGVDVDTVLVRGTSLDTVLINTGSTRKTVFVEAVTQTQFGCRDSRRISLNVNPPISARFNPPVDGCSPLTVGFRNTSVNTDDLYEWDFGDGTPTSADKNPRHTFRYNGYGDTTFIVTLTSRSNAFFQPVCEAVYRDTVRVSGRPVGAFSFLPDGFIRLPNNTITIRNQTPYRQAWKYQWFFGEGSTDTTNAAEFTHTLRGLFQELNTTNLTVTLIVMGSSACPDTVQMPLTVLPIKPIADFGPDTSGCAPLDVIFSNRSKWASQYYWTFGDGTSSTEQNPIHRYSRPGIYSVRLFVSGPGGGDTLSRDTIITVHDIPSAAFTTFPRLPRKLRLPSDSLVCILREPQPRETYLWSFGDGQTSTEAEPRHLYAAAGSYGIALQVTSEFGCVATDTSSTPVVAENGYKWVVPNGFSPNPDFPSSGLVDANGQPLDGSINDVFYPYTEGVTEIDLQIFNRWGEAIFRSTEVGRGWNGYYKGVLCKSDTYVYKVKARFISGEVRTEAGTVTLVR